MTTSVTAFVCDFCERKKRFASKRGADQHERQCFRNPVRRACASCQFLSCEIQSGGDGLGDYEFKVWGCELGITPIPATPEEPERRFIADCEKWEPKQPLEARNG